MTFYIFLKKPTDAAKKAVSNPMIKINVMTKSDITINSENLTVRNTPAVTIVAA